MQSQEGENAKKLFEKIQEQFRDGMLKIDIDKDRNVDHFIAVTSGGKTYTNCKELVNVYRDLDDNLAYTVTQYIDKSEDFYEIRVDVHDNGFLNL